MADQYQKISHLLEDQIPDFVQEFYPLYVIFMTKYFEYLENTSTGVQYSIQNIELNRDIDTTASSLAVQFLNTYVPFLPDEAALDQTVLVKYFKDFYRLKGSIQSIKYFFKAFFDDNDTVSYPREYLFKPSDGTWYIEKKIRVQAIAGNPLNLEHSYITGNTTGASAAIENITQISGFGLNVYDIVLNSASMRGSFATSEVITGIARDYVNNVSSAVTMTSWTSTISLPGRYIDTKSQLSANQVLQDSYYYQQFSYVIRTSQDKNVWLDHVLNHLHPTGDKLFGDFYSDTIPTNKNSSFATTNRTVTSVKIPSIKSFYVVPTFSFDRTADLQTGTSQSLLATTTGFTVVNYTTSIGAISYDNTYDYPGEHITWALQKTLDLVSSVTEIVRFDGAMFDKLRPSIDIEDQIITWPYDANTGLTTTRFAAVSSVYASSQVLLNITSGVLTYKIPAVSLNSTSVGSMIFLLTYVKNSRGNQAGEEDNAIVVRLSSTATIVPYHDNETQRNLKAIALNNTLGLNNLIYYHSSNSVQSYVPLLGTSSCASGSPDLVGAGTQFLSQLVAGDLIYVTDPARDETDYYTVTAVDSNTDASVTPNFRAASSNATVYKAWISGAALTSQLVIANNEARFKFKPYNGQRGLTYDRMAIRVEIDQELQRNTSLTELFETVSITSTGLIASWSSFTTSVSTNSFTSTVSSAYTFDSNAFVFNGTTSQSRFVQTRTFPLTQRLDLTLKYVVGDSYNGGEIPDSGENLTVQFTYDGTTWFDANDLLWAGSSSNAWTFGSTSVSGKVWTTLGSTTLNGSGTLFSTDLKIGDRILINTSVSTTAYTITNIVNNTNLVVNSPIPDLFRSSVAVTGLVYGPDNTTTGASRLFGIGTSFLGLKRDDQISLVSSTTTSFTIVNVIDDQTIDVTPALINNYYTSTTLTGTLSITTGTGLATLSGTSSAGFSTGNVLRFDSSSITSTAYTVIGRPGTSSILVSPAFIDTSSGLSIFRTTGVGAYLQNSGVDFYKIKPIGEQFKTTSITVYGPGPLTSVTMRIIQISATGPNNDVYAIDNMKVDSFRYQSTTGVVNLHVSVSSGTSLYVSDTDYIDITTIGTL